MNETKKYWIITNTMYSAYSEHEISSIYFGTWMEAAREAVEYKRTSGCSCDGITVEELVLNEKKSGYVINNSI